jgi:hypothetical protein
MFLCGYVMRWIFIGKIFAHCNETEERDLQQQVPFLFVLRFWRQKQGVLPFLRLE